MKNVMMKVWLSFDRRTDKYFHSCSRIVKTDDDIEAEKLEKGIKKSILELVNKREGKLKMDIIKHCEGYYQTNRYVYDKFLFEDHQIYLV